MTQGGVKHEKNPANIELTRQLKTVLESWLVWTIIPRSRCWAFLLLWDIWPTGLLTRQQLFYPSTNHPTKLTSVLQEVVRLVDPTPLPQSPFKPLRKDSLVWRPATSTNIRGLSSLSPSWASTWCTGWSISPFRKRKDTKSLFRTVN